MRDEMEEKEDDQIPIVVGVRLAPASNNNSYGVNNGENSGVCVFIDPTSNKIQLGPDREFSFDYAYSSHTSQQDVFLSCIEPFISTLLDGYNISVLCYGGTGTGKTYSLMGPDLTPALNEEQFGVIPRFVRTLFHSVDNDFQTKYTISASYLDVYNKELKDLLSEDCANVTIEIDTSGKTRLQGLSKVECTSISEVLACLDTGQSYHRSNFPNLYSNSSFLQHNITSPAHSIFSLTVKQSYSTPEGLTVKESCIQFFDLASSDKLNQNCGEINIGLLTLGNVVSALGDPRRNVSYVPFKDSLLTRLLVPALNGNSVTFLLTTISPLAQDYEETLNSLLFASWAANIRTNPVPNIYRVDQTPTMDNYSPTIYSQQNLPRLDLHANLAINRGVNQFPVQNLNMISAYTVQQIQDRQHNTLENLYSSPGVELPPSQHLDHLADQYTNLEYQHNVLNRGRIPVNPPCLSPPTSGGRNPFNPSCFSPASGQQLGSQPFLPTQVLSPTDNTSIHPTVLPMLSPSGHLAESPAHHIHHPILSPHSQTQISNQPSSHPSFASHSSNPLNPWHSTPLTGGSTPLQGGIHRPQYAGGFGISNHNTLGNDLLGGGITPTTESPLPYQSPLGINMYLPAQMISRSDSSLYESISIPSFPSSLPLLGNQGHVLLSSLDTEDLTAPRRVPAQYMQSGYVTEQTGDESVFQLHFAATQYKNLLTGAENLLSNISQNKELEGADRHQIQTWMHRKEESEEAIKKNVDIEIKRSGGDPAGDKLEKILEESEDETESQLSGTASSGSSSVEDSDCFNSMDSVQSICMMDPPVSLSVGSLISSFSSHSSEDFNSECSEISQLDIKILTIQDKLFSENKKIVDERQRTLLADAEIQSLLRNFNKLFAEDVNDNIDKKTTSASGVDDEEISDVRNSAEQIFAAGLSEKQISSAAVAGSEEHNSGAKVSQDKISPAKDQDRAGEPELKLDSAAVRLNTNNELDCDINCDDKIALNERLVKLSSSAKQHAGQVKQADDDLDRLKVQLHDFKGVIKAKEGLIKDLKKAGKESEEVRRKLETKLGQLEKESKRSQRELVAAQSMLKKLQSGKEMSGSCLEEDYRKKVDKYKIQVDELKMKVIDTEQLLQFTKPEATEIMKLQESIRYLKEEHEALKFRYNEEQVRKSTLEAALDKDKEVIDMLREKLESTQQVLQKSLERSQDMESRQEWLMAEEKRLKEVEHNTFILQQQLAQKEKLLSSGDMKETSFIEKDKRESKPVINTEITEQRLRGEVNDLRYVRDAFVRERQELDEKLEEMKFLSPDEERRMVELDESVEAVDAAIEYKNDILLKRSVDYSGPCGNLLLDRLARLPVNEVKSLLHKYFKRVLDLRMEGRKLEVHVEEVEEQYNDLGRYVRDLAHSLQRSKLEGERRLVAQQREYQMKINLLVQQLAEDGGGGGGAAVRAEEERRQSLRRIKYLEKEVHYYKKLARDLRSGHEDREMEIVQQDQSRPYAVAEDPVQAYETYDVAEAASEAESTVSHVQASHIQQFQRKLARLQRKMEPVPKATVTREHRKIIIENPVQMEDSLDRKKGKSRKKK